MLQKSDIKIGLRVKYIPPSTGSDTFSGVIRKVEREWVVIDWVSDQTRRAINNVVYNIRELLNDFSSMSPLSSSNKQLKDFL